MWGTQSKPLPSRRGSIKEIFFSSIKEKICGTLQEVRLWADHDKFRLIAYKELGVNTPRLHRILDRLLLRVQSAEWNNFYGLDIELLIDILLDHIDVASVYLFTVTNFCKNVKLLESLIALYGDSVPAPDLESAYKNFISALVHRIVYQYLIGYVDRGGAETYNSGSLEFGATYISLLLFKAAYFWIWFREVASRKVSRRERKDKFGNSKFGKWEPKFKPAREKDARGRSQEFQCLRLGGYDTEWAAEVVCQIARFYYNKDEALVKLVADGFEFVIPPLTEQEQGLAGMEKWNMVSDKAKDVYNNFKEAHDRYITIRSNVEQDVELSTEQGGGNGPHDHTRLLQPLTNLSDILDAASSGIEATLTGSNVEDYDFDQMPEILPSRDIQEGSSALLPDSAVSGADAIAGEANIFRAGVGDINKFGEGQGTSLNHAAIATAYPSRALTNLEASETPNLEVSTSQPSEKWRQIMYQEIMFGDIQLPTQQDAGHVNDLDDHTLPQPLILDRFSDRRDTITTQAQAHALGEGNDIVDKLWQELKKFVFLNQR